MLQRYGTIIILLILGTQPCHALAAVASTSPSKIISRKSDGLYKTYNLINDGEDKNDVDGTHDNRQHKFHPSVALHRVQSALRSTFLPALPSSNVKGKDKSNNYQLDKLRSSGYIKYILYDNIQDLSTSLRSVLATQRILEGVGVGRADATALSATLNFVIRDMSGMVASLLFTSMAASSFRRNVKRWKLFADIMVNIGITLEIIAPSINHKWFLPLLCLGTICKALCGVAAGACGGALQMYWANALLGSEEGISEIAAKNGAQRTVMGGLGLVLAALVAKYLGNSSIQTVIGLYLTLTIFHLVTNYKALKLISLDWLNGWRLHKVVEEFLACMDDKNDGRKVNEESIIVSTPSEASKEEPLLFLPEWRSMNTKYPIRMGLSFNELSRLSYQPASSLQYHIMKRGSSKDNYLLTVGEIEGRRTKNRCILISYFSNSSSSEKAKASLHACLVRRALVSSLTTCNKEHNGSENDIIQEAEDNAERKLAQLWPIFKRCVTDSGWKLDKTECSTEGYELFIE